MNNANDILEVFYTQLSVLESENMLKSEMQGLLEENISIISASYQHFPSHLKMFSFSVKIMCLKKEQLCLSWMPENFL